MSSWAYPPKGGVEVLQPGYELPDAIQSDLSTQGILEDVEGFFLPSQEKVYLLVDNVRCSVDRPLRVLFHEVYGHRGLRALLGPTARAKTLYRLQRANPKLAQEALAWYASHGESDIKHRIRKGATESDARREVTLMAIEEALADRAAQLPKVSPALRRRAIRQWRLRMSGNDALADRMEEIWEAETFMLLAEARSITVAGLRRKTRAGPGRRPSLRNEAALPHLRTGATAPSH
ncbi:hypothetical protein [Cupriavidus sp. UYPR2.512]|uniref:hypothetical protein n=1 Tax=Cupriavidus sp. UYPR2.512 TaxID=1080187 RepID=UPI0012FB7571|nr:hypothetical protein [Cupriavidus sp. UYPR2.512]UIF89198.1 hypothetical protein KAF44_29910 [Cupriavidus necator]